MKRPIAWTIAGSDPGSGAGIQADLKTMNALGVHGCSVIAALTAQNTTGVTLTEPVSQAMLQAQLDALESDLPPVAVKLGMLGDPEGIHRITQTLSRLNACVIGDPVTVATSGDSLLADDSIRALKDVLFPQIDLLTPNMTEAETLLDRSIKTDMEIELAAADLLKLGVKSVLLKGGHRPGAFSQDFYTDGEIQAWLTSPWQETQHNHGTGCTLSAAICASIALGYDPLDAIVIAKAYVNQGLRLAPGLGQGHGPLAHLDWPETHSDIPWLTPTAEEGRSRLQFLDCGPEPLGFYPIVNRFEWLEKMLPLGVSTIQLRIKDLTGEDLEREIAQASAYAKQFDARLFINDYWQLALKYNAYGVHLGQEDLEAADLKALADAGIRLGVSTHCYREVACALSLRPSYMAIGPIHATTTKAMKFEPQGLEALRRWRKTLPYPLVAIGGIFLDNASEVLACGADGIAVVRDITQAADLPDRVRQWLNLFENKSPKRFPVPV